MDIDLKFNDIDLKFNDMLEIVAVNSISKRYTKEVVFIKEKIRRKCIRFGTSSTGFAILIGTDFVFIS